MLIDTIHFHTFSFAIISFVYPVVDPILTPNLFRRMLIVSGVPEWKVRENVYIHRRVKKKFLIYYMIVLTTY